MHYRIAFEKLGFWHNNGSSNNAIFWFKKFVMLCEIALFESIIYTSVFKFHYKIKSLWDKKVNFIIVIHSIWIPTIRGPTVSRP